LKKKRQAPQTVIVSGFLDTIEFSQNRFRLAMKNGETLQGKIDKELISPEQMRKLWGQQVTIKGVLHYQPSGKPNFLEAQVIQASRPGDEIFEKIDTPKSVAQIWAEVESEMSGRDVVAEIWGKWPGDESIEEILDALKAMK
jgi:hypothetical protein